MFYPDVIKDFFLSSVLSFFSLLSQSEETDMSLAGIQKFDSKFISPLKLRLFKWDLI